MESCLNSSIEFKTRTTRVLNNFFSLQLGLLLFSNNTFRMVFCLDEINNANINCYEMNIL